MSDSTADVPEAPRPEPYRLLFVCTGNTCRSPMAEVIAREQVRRRGWPHVEVGSAGTFASRGGPAAEEARRVAAEHGLDLEDHRSRPLSAEDVTRADVILGMTASHVEMAAGLGAGERVALLAELGGGVAESVPDPIGQGIDAYRATWRVLERWIDGVLTRLEPVVAP
ncbi:MAG: low molecular weight protein arginine phosphatase [Gemmatimonadetes bacterium]|nr:low molecular weight protein arginine phosphatase [Gemmatimonadota bacterium]